MLTFIILEAATDFRLGTLNMPQFKTTPEVYADELVEQISIKKNPEEAAALKIIGFTQKGTPLEYGQADMVRELIKRYHAQFVGPVEK